MDLRQFAKDIENSDVPVAISALVAQDSVGYPKRIVDPDEDSFLGEHDNFDEAYDFACDILDVDSCEVEKDGAYVWFKKA